MNEKNKKNDRYKWLITVCTMSFCLSLIFSFSSEMLIPKINIFFGIIVILLFILLGIIFDMIGVAITAANERPFHSMAAKKVRGSSHSVKLLKNSDKIASICNDVIGDVCGVVSGGGGMLVANSISTEFKLNPSLVVLLVTAIIASITITGKAFSKSKAIKKSEEITFKVGKILKFFSKK